MMAGAFEGRAILITGGGRGIGRAAATHLAAKGAKILIDDRGAELDGTGHDPMVAEDAAKAIVDAGGEAIATSVDVSTPGAAAELVSRTVERFGRIDGVVVAHGLKRERGIMHLTDDDLAFYLSNQVHAAFSLTQAAARAMIDAKQGGAIVHMTAPEAFFGSARRTLASAAAAAIAGLTRSVAVELRKHGIRVNAVAATARTRTTEELPMFKGVREGSMSPEHVAPVVTYLLSADASDVFGEVVGVAGGRLYGLRARETTGVFSEGRPFTEAEIAESFAEAMRGPGAHRE
jgi:NAD(P)-dependent dehydrogenase (short-subunit alcohol dehydrogenase family)